MDALDRLRYKGRFIREYSFNENYFSCVDTEDKAYWLGFIAADGCLTGNQTLLVQLKSNDKEHLEKLRFALNHLKELDIIKEKQYSNYVAHEAVKLTVHSRKLRQDLLKYNITPKKSLTLHPPTTNLPRLFIRHFIRGYIDGDGGFWIHSKKYLQFEVLGTEKILLFIQNNLPQEVQKISHITKTKDITETLRLRIFLSCKKPIRPGGRGRYYELIDLYNYLYSDSNIYLERKEKIIHDYIRRCG